MSFLNIVETSVSIAGNQVHFVRLQLHQKFNTHHKAEVIVDFSELDSQWMNSIISIIKMIGEPLTITMKHKESGETNTFGGIITNVSAVGSHGRQNQYKITGMSESVKLDGKGNMDSFVDDNLENIVNQIIANSGNGAAVTVKPVFSEKIDYFSQYKETAFDVLNRLSWIYNEWFFCDGITTYFGKPDKLESFDIVYDLDLSHFNLSANLIPPKVNRYNYLVHVDKEINSDAPDTVRAVGGYVKVSKDRADSLYTSEVSLPLETQVNHKKELDDLMDLEKNRIIAGMLIFEGKATSCKIKIGSIANISLPSSMKVPKDVESFLITEVTHVVDQAGHYSNTFKGVPSGFESIPMNEVPNPVAASQIATVMNNADDKGRIKVQHQWQRNLNKQTNWIRVQTPDAGSSTNVPANRGFVFIPEEGDQVMIGFEDSNPSRPYVMGSMFTEYLGKGGYSSNHLKSIKTRSGHIIEFNDTEGGTDWGITIKDQNDNYIHLDTTGKNITISAPEKVTINASNIVLDAKEDITLTAGNNIDSAAGNDIVSTASRDVLLNASGSIEEICNTRTEIVEKDYSRSSKTSDHVGDEVDIVSANENMTVQGAQTVVWNSGEKSKLF